MNLLIVDDHPLIRKSLFSVFSMESDIDNIFEAANIDDAIKHLNKNIIDISIIDLRLGSENGLEIIARSKSEKKESKFIVLTSSPEYGDFLKAVELGIDGYILKKAFVEDIIYALHIVERGNKYFDPELMQHNINHREHEYLYELTEREKDVLAELGEGKSNSDIAKKLFISENTVKKHISSILSKLGLSHRIEAAIYINKIADKESKI